MPDRAISVPQATQIAQATKRQLTELNGRLAQSDSEIEGIENALNTGLQNVNATWEYGAWAVDSEGILTPQAGNSRVRCTAPVPAEVGKNLYVTVESGYKYVIGFINENNKRISETGWVTENRTIAITQPYITIVVANTSNTNIASIDDILTQFTFGVEKTYGAIERIESEIERLGTGGITYKSKVTFETLSTTNADMHIVDGSQQRFSNLSKMIYVTNGISNAEAKLSNLAISNWKSLTFSVYVPFEGLQTSSGFRSELTVSFNAIIGRRYGFTGKLYGGWNMVKFNRSEFNQSDDLSVITALNFRLIPIGGAVTHGFITLDAVFVDLEVKPTIAFMFDQTWQESIDNGAYEYMRSNGIPYTIATNNYVNLPQTIKDELAIAKKHGNDFGYYAAYGSNNDYVVHGATFEEASDNLLSALSDAIGVVGIRPVVYSATRGEDSEVMQESTKHIGFEYICGGTVANRDIAYFDDVATKVPRNALWENQTLDAIKAHIDALIEYGSFSLFFTHGVCADGNSYMTKDGVLTTSSGVQLTIFKGVIDYVVSLRNEGRLNICLLRNAKQITKK